MPPRRRQAPSPARAPFGYRKYPCTLSDVSGRVAVVELNSLTAGQTVRIGVLRLRVSPLRIAPLRMTPLLRLAPPAHDQCRRFTAVVLGIDDNVPLQRLSSAFGAQIGMIAQGKMHETALARSHGSEGVGNSGAANLLGSNFRRHAELF